MTEKQSQTTSTSVQEAPVPEGYMSWPDHWKSRGMSWRTEPEISGERQRYLAERRSIPPDIDNGVYPFRDVKLDRADVEWLLATHESDGMRGPVDWDDTVQRHRQGLDLRGALLGHGKFSGLPLAKLQGGNVDVTYAVTGAYASYIQALKSSAELYRSAMDAVMTHAMSMVGLSFASRLVARFARRRWTPYGRKYGPVALDQREIDQFGLVDATKSRMAALHVENADLTGTDLRGAILNYASLDGALVASASFQDVQLHGASLRSTILIGAHLEGARLDEAVLQRSDLRSAYFSLTTSLAGADLASRQDGVGPRLVDLNWGGTNLTTLDWGRVKVLGDEEVFLLSGATSRRRRQELLSAREVGARANRQLAVALRNQGVNDVADRFSYRALVLQRQVLRRRHKYLSALGTWLLDLMSGFGYKPMRSFITYVLVVGAFALTYYLLGSNVNPPLDPLSALVFSITSFHGRGFAPGENVALSNPLTVIAAGEAIIGLLIEITFIATFTQRFFAR